MLLGRTAMTSLDSILKSRDIPLPTKVRLVKAMVFPVVMCGCESWTIKKADAFELWCWRLLRVPWTARRSNQFILKEISPGCSLVGLMLKLKLQYFDHLMWSSVQFSRSVVSDSLRPHESQHARPPCPSPTLEFTQTHVHWVGDAIQPSHPLSSPSPPVLNLSQHQGLFKWVSSSHQVAKVLEFQLQRQSLQWTPRTDLL